MNRAFGIFLLFVAIFWPLFFLLPGCNKANAETEKPLKQGERIGIVGHFYIDRFHDEENKITCYKIGESVSCLHDK